MDIREIMEYLPHQYPMLLVDKVLDYVAGESLTAIKNVTINEPFFMGHFPGNPIMPGVLIIEALAQTSGILAFKSIEKKPEDGLMYYLVGVEKSRFKKTVVPGDVLTLEVSHLKTVRNLWKFDCKAMVEGNLVAQAIIKCAAIEG